MFLLIARRYLLVISLAKKLHSEFISEYVVSCKSLQERLCLHNKYKYCVEEEEDLEKLVIYAKNGRIEFPMYCEREDGSFFRIKSLNMYNLENLEKRENDEEIFLQVLNFDIDQAYLFLKRKEGLVTEFDFSGEDHIREFISKSEILSELEGYERDYDKQKSSWVGLDKIGRIREDFGFFSSFFYDDPSYDGFDSYGRNMDRVSFKETLERIEGNSNKVRFSSCLGVVLGVMASRNAEVPEPMVDYVINSGILDDPDIKKVWDGLINKYVERDWGKQIYNPVRDYKINFIMNSVRKMSLSLDDQVRWSEYLKSKKEWYCIDLIRGNDPTAHEKDYLSALSQEHETGEVGYYPGIYFGTVGGFYEWSMTEKAILRNTPLYLMSFSGIGSEAIIEGKKLYFDEENIEYLSGTDKYLVINGQNVSVEPYDDPEGKVFSEILHGNGVYFRSIPREVLDGFKRYYPEAKIEKKKITFMHYHWEDVLDPIDVEVPYIVLSEDAINNPLKLETIKKWFDVSNVVIEKRDI